MGGQAARDTDEELGRRWGIIGQETTGVGGLAKGLRTIPAALAVQAAVAAHAAPDAWLVNFTNPAGMVTEALLAHGTGDPPRVVGLCNFPWVLRERLAAGLGATADRIDLDYVGLNHLAWVREVRLDGDRGLAAAREVWRSGPDAPFADSAARRPGPDPESLPAVLLRDRADPGRPARDADPGLGGRRGPRPSCCVGTTTRRPAWDPQLLAGRGGASYSVAAAGLAADLVDPHQVTPGRHVVNVLNRGALPGLPDDSVVETTCLVGSSGAVPVATEELTGPARGLANQVKDFERYAIEAATTGDRRAARLALVTHPLCPDAGSAGRLLDDLLATNRAWLPAFS